MQVADNVEMQGIEFKIVNDSTQAVAGLNNLTDTLKRLKAAAGGGISGLSKTAKGIRDISSALKGLNSGDFSQKISRIAGALGTLERVGTTKISSSIANQLSAINEAVANVQWTDGDKLAALADGLRPLSELGKANMTTFITQLGKLPELIEKLDKADLDKFTQQMKDLAAAMEPFADEMQKVSAGFSSFPSRIQQVIASSEQYNNAMRGATANTNGWNRAIKGIRAGTIALAFRKIAQFLGRSTRSASEYLEDMNLFTVSMEEYAEEAYQYAQQVSEIMGIDPAEWMRNQGVFNTIITGFGVASDKAALMSKNLTQLGYDIASFYNISFEDSMQKVQSGIAGELEPLRRIGYDLSVARLQQEAYNLGITKSVSAMTQAEKAQLRYYTMMTQVTQVQGDMARTLEQPTNMIRVLQAQFEQAARAIGNLFIPVLTKLLPFLIAVADALRQIIAAIAALFNVEIQTPAWGTAVSGSAGVADNLSAAAGSAKELTKYLAGFDELNVLPSQNQGGGSAGVGGGGGDLGIDLPEYNFLEGAVTEQIDAWKKKIEPVVKWVEEHLTGILEAAVSIGSAIAAWKIAKSMLTGIETLEGLVSHLKSVSIGFKIVGLAGFIDAMNRFTKWAKDFANNGPTLDNIVGMVTSFAGMIGYALTLLGHTKLGGALILVDGLGQIFLALRDISQNGVNMDNVLDAVHGLGNVLTAVGALTGNPILTGGGFTLSGVTTIIKELSENWDAIKQGDWSGVDFGLLAIGAIEAIGGILIAIGKIKGITDKIGGAKEITQASTTLQGTADAIGGSTGGLNGSLKNVAQNLGWGIVIVAEVSAAAIIAVGAIWALGEELGKVGEAWQPVIENAGTVAIAIGVGAGLIAAVGLAAYGLGTLGGAAALNIGVGTAILLELGIATGLFVVEIWAIGKVLDEIEQAWQPVLDNGETIATAIGIGTGLLVGIGVVTAALGTATVASAGLLPAAIGVGTGILAELAAAFVLFTESLVDVADEINDNLAPTMSKLNPKLPKLKNNMEDFSEYMTDLAAEISSYSKSMGRITWSSIVNSFRKLFSDDPIGTLAGDVNGIYNDTVSLNTKLNLANPELTLAVTLMTSYVDLMSQLQTLSEDGSGAGTLAYDVFTNLKTVGENLVVGLTDGINAKMPTFKQKMEEFKSSIASTFASAATSACTSIQQIVDKLQKIPSTISTSVNVKQANTANHVKAYASGGFADQGQLFIAREAGPEMVGTIGNRAAVANNDQIVEAIKEGVYEAVYAAVNNSRGDGNQSIHVYLDGKELAAGMNRRNRMYGAAIANV